MGGAAVAAEAEGGTGVAGEGQQVGAATRAVAADDQSTRLLARSARSHWIVLTAPPSTNSTAIAAERHATTLCRTKKS